MRRGLEVLDFDNVSSIVKISLVYEDYQSGIALSAYWTGSKGHPNLIW